ncbi:hypothetical protein FPV67DRAFT_790762 [Lyophyllum atratum]|nr:hypothetical protein FPV67DRAFT_790762 [Lyophyllum atratum]
MIPASNTLWASLTILSTYIFWVSSVPPTPPASATETKRPLPWIRIHAIANAIVVGMFMLLSAYRTLINGYMDDPFMKHICPASMLHASAALPRGAIVGYPLLFLGGHIRIAAQRTLGKYFTWEISLKKDHKLCTIGPYSVVRHPGYLGIWIVRVAIDIIQSSSETVLNDCLRPRYPTLVNLLIWENYLFTASLFVWMSFRAKWEDDLMKKEFSVSWKRWAEQTPYRIVPYIY